MRIKRDRLRTLVRQRLSGVPLAHLTERQSFMGLEMLAGPGALIPRAETELLAQAATALLHQMAKSSARLVVVDVCTGSGNLAARPGARRTTRDRLRVGPVGGGGRARAPQYGPSWAWSNRVTLRVGDLLAPFARATHSGSRSTC